MIGGKPSDPLNGALFVDGNTGDETTSDLTGVFSKFALLVDGARNPLAGVTSYISQNQTTWKKSWVQKAKPSGGKVKISSPSGNPPSYGGDTNWLEMPVAYTKRGNVYSCSQTWLASGPAGWHPDLY